MKKILYIVLIICLVVGLTATSCKAKKNINNKYINGYFCDFGGSGKVYRIQFGEVKK